MLRRVVVKGSSGAGKSTLGRELARRLHVPFVELDALHHGPNWTEASAEELCARVAAALDDQRGWVVDGNYDSKLGELVVARAELVIWLDLPLLTKLVRLTRRTLQRWWRAEELWNGNRETLSGVFWGKDALFTWSLHQHFAHRRMWPQRFSQVAQVRLCTAREVSEWLAQFDPLPAAQSESQRH